ncbi:MAG: YihY/virulence factor BrkB family protein [Dehalococcoidia bacterium]
MLGRAASNFAEDRGTQLAASISYYALFSLFPLTLLAISIFGIVLRDEAIQLRVLNGIINYLPVENTTVADSLRQTADLGPTVTIVSLVGAIWTSAALAAAIRQTLNQVFEVRRRRPMARAKLIDLTLLPVIGVPLLGGIVLTAIWRLFQREFTDRIGLVPGDISWAWDLGALAIPLAMSFVAFAALYRFAPNISHPWRYIVPGALFAAVAFEALKAGFAFYLQNFGNYSIYGSLGSVIILLFWVYLTANILIFGAEVSSEIPHVLRQEPRHGTRADEGDWRHALLAFAKGLFMVQDDEEADPVHAPPEETPTPDPPDPPDPPPPAPIRSP